MDWKPVNSRLISALRYDTETQTLHLKMKSGETRKYRGSVAAEFSPLLKWANPDLYLINALEKPDCRIE